MKNLILLFLFLFLIGCQPRADVYQKDEDGNIRTWTATITKKGIDSQLVLQYTGVPGFGMPSGINGYSYVWQYNPYLIFQYEDSTTEKMYCDGDRYRNANVGDVWKICMKNGRSTLYEKVN
jgi:hypothetical protein